MVGDDDVEAPERSPRGVDEGRWGVGVGQVGGQVLDSAPRRPQLREERSGAADGGAPGLIGVMGRPRVQHDRGPVGGEAAGDGSADGDPPAGARYQGHPTGQRLQVRHGP